MRALLGAAQRSRQARAWAAQAAVPAGGRASFVPTPPRTGCGLLSLSFGGLMRAAGPTGRLRVSARTPSLRLLFASHVRPGDPRDWAEARRWGAHRGFRGDGGGRGPGGGIQGSMVGGGRVFLRVGGGVWGGGGEVGRGGGTRGEGGGGGGGGERRTMKNCGNQRCRRFLRQDLAAVLDLDL